MEAATPAPTRALPSARAPTDARAPTPARVPTQAPTHGLEE